MTLEEAHKLIARQPNQRLLVFVVLREDLYETNFGDGYFAYLHDAFLTWDQAGRCAAEQDLERATRVANGATYMGFAHHVIEVELGIVDDDVELVSVTGQFDAASASKVVAALDAPKP